MAITLKHKKNSTVADSANADMVQPSDWNNDHDLNMATGAVIGRVTAGNGTVEELPLSKFVITDTQTLTAPQQAQARTNIGLNNVPNKTEAQMVDTGAIADALGGKFDKTGGTIAGPLNVSSPTGWTQVDIRSPLANGEACLDFTGGGSSVDFMWRFRTANGDWDFDLEYAGAGGGAVGRKLRINRDGNMTTSGNVGAFSDERLKSEIEDIEDALSLVLKLAGKKYTKDGRRQFGFLAGASRVVVPELVGECRDKDDQFLLAGSDTGTLYMDVGNQIPALLVESIRTINERLLKIEEKLK